jgi:hypothetical protein
MNVWASDIYALSVLSNLCCLLLEKKSRRLRSPPPPQRHYHVQGNLFGRLSIHLDIDRPLARTGILVLSL